MLIKMNTQMVQKIADQPVQVLLMLIHQEAREKVQVQQRQGHPVLVPLVEKAKGKAKVGQPGAVPVRVQQRQDHPVRVPQGEKVKADQLGAAQIQLQVQPAVVQEGAAEDALDKIKTVWKKRGVLFTPLFAIT